MESEEARRRVAEAVQTRIESLRISRRQLEQRSGVAFATWRKLLQGEPITRRDRLSAMEKALGGPPGIFDEIAQGRRPKWTDLSDAKSVEDLGRRLDELQEQQDQTRTVLTRIARHLGLDPEGHQ